jgi:hypothetical protein
MSSDKPEMLISRSLGQEKCHRRQGFATRKTAANEPHSPSPTSDTATGAQWLAESGDSPRLLTTQEISCLIEGDSKEIGNSMTLNRHDLIDLRSHKL